MRRKEIAIILLTAVLFIGVWAVVSKVSEANEGAQTQYVYDAVHNAALTCYAVEGAYPDDLDYLKSNYGLVYDESTYIVDYDAFASNLLPEIYVIEVEADDK